MRTRLRLGAVAAVGLGALLLATVLASPALAWHSNVTVSARCLDGQVRVHYIVEAWKPGHEATVTVKYYLNGEETTLESEDFYFAEHHNRFSDHFDLPADTTGTITFVVVADWKDAPATTDEGSAKLPPAGKCQESTPSSTPSTTPTTAPQPSVAPSTSETTPTTEETAVGAATSTTAPGQLPFTGTGSGPTLLTAILLLGGGALFLLLGRPRGRHVAR